MQEYRSIETARLHLVLLNKAVLKSFADGHPAQAAERMQVKLGRDCMLSPGLAAMRLQQIEDNPDCRQWLLRGIVRQSDNTLVGQIGFHTAPNPNYLQELAPGAVEIGYKIYPSYRRQGYAYEATGALIDWARQTHAVTDFVFSVSPDNVPSLRLLDKLGQNGSIQQIGSHIDPTDGPEDVFLLITVTSDN